jgi:tetratricopeptide (TPR) repeat protein
VASRRRAVARVVLAGLLALSPEMLPTAARADCSQASAASLYADARRAFEDHRYDDSVELLRRAYACDPNPVYLGNVARAYEEANRPKEALAAWRAYVEVVKPGSERVQAQGRISTLSKMTEDLDRLEREKNAAEEARRRAELQAAAARPPVPPARDDAPPSRHVSPGAWGVGGAGAAALVAGAVLGLEAVGRHGAAVAEPDVVQAESLQRDARSLATAANWTFAIGGALAAAGLAWACIDLWSSTPGSRRAAIGVAGPGLVLMGGF